MNLDQKSHRQLNVILVNVALLVICFLMLIPWILALSTALKAPGETAFNPGLIPQHIDLAKFVDVFVRADVGRLALNSLINLLLIPHVGIAGAAIASSLAYVALAVAFIVWLLRVSAVPPREMIPRPADVWVPLASLIPWGSRGRPLRPQA